MELSILIPARNEIFLKRTVEDILAHKEGKTEVIVVCDGNWPEPQLEDHPDVHMVYHSESVGQRAAMNEAARLSRAKHLMKVDAHCAFDQGFDVKLMADMRDDWTMVPVMRNLHAFDWVCPDGHRRYQSPSGPCKECGKPTAMDVKWIAKGNPQSTCYCFNSEPHFQYFTEFKKRPEYKGDLTDTMSLQGSCFMCTREKYWELELCDESFGSWGSQGIEIAVKTWLSGGRVVCNHKTWYAHMFRTQGGDFGFPYDLSGRQVSAAKKHAKEIFFNDKWLKQTRSLSWLLDKFWPVPGWTEEQRKGVTRTLSPVIEAVSEPKSVPAKLTKGVVYYTDNRCDEKIWRATQQNLAKCCNGHELVSVSLKPIDFGRNIVLPLERGHLTLFKQILAGVEAIGTDIVFLVEHDCLYPPCHFEYVPEKKDLFYYNENWWKVRVSDGQALQFRAKQLSGICGYTELFIKHYRARVEKVEKEGFTLRMGFEPGTYSPPRGVDNYKHNTWFSEVPYIDIRHEHNATPTRFSPDQYRHQVVNWKMADEVPGWGKTKGRFDEFLKEVI